MLLSDHTEQQISLGCDVNCDLQIILSPFVGP